MTRAAALGAEAQRRKLVFEPNQRVYALPSLWSTEWR